MSDISTDFEQNMLMKYFSKTDDIEKDMRKIIESSRDTAYRAVNTILVQRNWLIGHRIAEEDFLGGRPGRVWGKYYRQIVKDTYR